MHVPDGFFEAPVTVGAAVTSVAVVSYAARRSRDELSDAAAPMAGLMSAFVFAVQMLNFPVAAGTSGHLMGATLAAVLLGPLTATLCISVVLAMQALLFADGGLTALGINIVLMAIVPGFVGAAVFSLLGRCGRATNRGRAARAGVAALVSVPASAAVFAFLFAWGGAVELSLAPLLSAMVSVHVLIGIGEGVITATTVAAVLAARPDLMRAGARRALA